ncbi:MAG: c-type cytochrome [Bacteroidota bacterium]|nr:c-type cytochrome [Bacteroidota bacterium]
MKNRIILITISLATVSGPAAYAQADLHESVREYLNDPTLWIMGVAILFMVLALIAVSNSLNTIKAITLKAQGKSEKEIEKAQKEDSIMQKLTDSVPVEREAEVMLDHDYDGIKELDNNLPPWWLYGFYFTILWAIGYMFYYEFLGIGPDQEMLYEQEMAAAQEEVDAYLASASNLVDENSVVAIEDAARLEKGSKIFAQNCAACHAADGGGLVGPNLTDQYWIHGGSIQDVFKTIKYGVPAKGMIPWQDQLSPTQMQDVASYILTLQGTTPAVAKEPQGELYRPDGEAAADEAPADQGTEEVSSTEGDASVEM